MLRSANHKCYGYLYLCDSSIERHFGATRGQILLRSTLSPGARSSAGVDAVTVAKYEEGLMDNIRDRLPHGSLPATTGAARLHSPKPMAASDLSVYIFQSAVAEVLSAVSLPRVLLQLPARPKSYRD